MSDRLAEIEARWAKVTPGPWTADTSEPHDLVIWAGEKLVMNVGEPIARIGEACGEPADCEAIAAAPDDVAWLAREVRRLRDVLEAR